MDEARLIYRFRTLVWHMISRNVISRYKRSVLGVLWTLLDPIATTLIMAIVFSAFFAQGLPAYPIFLLSGLVVWNFISQASSGAITDLIGGNWLVGKIAIPRTIFAITSVGANLVNLAISLLPLAVLFFVWNLPISPALLFLPIALLIITLFTFGLGLLVSAFSIFFTDLLNIYTILLRLLLYLSGIFYVVSSLPQAYQPPILLNPIYHLILLFRDPIYLGTLPDTGVIIYSAIWAVSLFVIGQYAFLRLSDQIAYRV